MLRVTSSRIPSALFALLLVLAFWWLLRDPHPHSSGSALRSTQALEVGDREWVREVSSRTSAIVEIPEALQPAAEPVVEPPVADPAPRYPFDPQAPIPHLALNLEALQNPAAFRNFVSTNSLVNPARLPFTEQEAKKLLQSAQPEIGLTRQAQKRFLDEKSAAVNRAIAQYDGPRFKSYDEAASYARSAYQGTRLGSVIIKEHQGAQATMAIILDAEKELPTYLLYKEMLEVTEVAAARLRQLIETGAYR
jgi:hypothetical protein